MASIGCPAVVALEADDVADTANGHDGILLAQLLSGLEDPTCLHFYGPDAACVLEPLNQDSGIADQAATGSNAATFVEGLSRSLGRIAEVPLQCVQYFPLPGVWRHAVENTLLVLICHLCDVKRFEFCCV